MSKNLKSGVPKEGFSPPSKNTKSSKAALESLFSLQSTHSTQSHRKEYSLVSHETLLNYSENMHGQLLLGP